MRKIGLLVMALVLLGSVAASAEEVRIYTWSEYMDEEKMPADFEKKFGIKVRLDIYENNEEMVAKLQAGGVSQYDIIVPSDYIMPVLINQKLIQPLDHAKLPNINNLKPLFRETSYDPGGLQNGTTYYWRVDASDGTTTVKGGVWTFTTAPAGQGGLNGEYIQGADSLASDPVLTRTDPVIDFERRFLRKQPDRSSRSRIHSVPGWRITAGLIAGE